MVTILAIGGGTFFLALVLTVAAERKHTRGACPSCRSSVAFASAGACSRCGEALRVRDGAIVVAESGFVPDRFAFATDLTRLKPAAEWAQVWPGRCCICRRAATRTERVKVKTIVGQAGAFPIAPIANLTRDHKYAVEYCGEHRGGFAFVFPPGFGNAKRNEDCRVYMCAVDFYRAFMRANARSAS